MEYHREDSDGPMLPNTVLMYSKKTNLQLPIPALTEQTGKQQNAKKGISKQRHGCLRVGNNNAAIGV
jgi:hypothetical protein